MTQVIDIDIGIDIDVDQIITHFHDEDKCETQINRSKSGRCPNCHQSGVFIDEGVVICQGCYCERGESIDDSAEWRNYSVDDQRGSDPNRCGSSIHPLLIESSLGTVIGLSRSVLFNHLKRLNTWQSMPYNERSLKMVFDRLSQNGLRNGLTLNIIEFSHKLYSKPVMCKIN